MGGVSPIARQMWAGMSAGGDCLRVDLRGEVQVAAVEEGKARQRDGHLARSAESPDRTDRKRSALSARGGLSGRHGAAAAAMLRTRHHRKACRLPSPIGDISHTPSAVRSPVHCMRNRHRDVV